LDPLLERFKKNGGRVYPKGPAFLLMVEFKTEPAETYRALNELLGPYEGMLTRFEGRDARPGAVTIVITGGRPRKQVRREAVRYAAIDGDLDDIGSEDPPTLVPTISAKWGAVFKWKGEGPFPE